MSYGRQFHSAGAAQRKVRDQSFVRDEHGLSCLLLAEDLSARRKILLVIRDLRCWFTRLHEFVSQSGNLIVYAPLDKKPMQRLQSLGNADASSLTCHNTSERALQTLKQRNVRNRVGIIETTANERTGNVLGTVECEIGTNVAKCTDVTETGFRKC